MEKRLGLNFSNFDAYVNVAGGIKIQEPAADLGVVASLLSLYYDKPLPEDICFVGEVGLAGEVRGVGSIDKRINEAKKMGFSKVFVPSMRVKEEGIEVLKVKDIREVMEFVKKL
jgi:DNA repair protein RadA/Sms